MKKPRIADFDPDAKVPSLKAPLDDMPAIVRVKKELAEAATTNELRGRSAFFPGYKREGSSSAQPKESKLGAQPSSTPSTGSTPSTTRSPVRDVRVPDGFEHVEPRLASNELDLTHQALVDKGGDGVEDGDGRVGRDGRRESRVAS